MSKINSPPYKLTQEGTGYNTVSFLMVQHNVTPNIQCGAIHGPQIRYTVHMGSQKNKTMRKENKNTGNKQHGFFHV
jgi:hypothetical protein